MSSCLEIVWITIADAAKQSGLHEGTMSRDAKRYGIKDNGIKGKGRRLDGGSFVRWLIERDRREAMKTESDKQVEEKFRSTARTN